MSGYSLLYLVHFLVFALMTILTFVIDVETPAVGCEDDPSTLMTMLMVAQYLYMGCCGMALITTGLASYFANNFLPGDFGKLSRGRKCLGFFVRISVMIINLAHWILIAPMAFFLLTAFTATECYLTNMGTSSIMLMAIPFFWLLQHLVCFFFESHM